jgi:hypothetical protein
MQPDDRGSAATSKAQSTAGWRRIGSTRPLRFLVALPARPEATALEAALSRSDSPGHESCGRDGFTADCVNLPAYCCSVMGVAVRGPRPATHTVLGRERLTEIGAARVCRHSTGSGCLETEDRQDRDGPESSCAYIPLCSGWVQLEGGRKRAYRGLQR